MKTLITLPESNEFKLRIGIDYRLGHELAVEYAKRALQRNSIVKVVHFPLNKTDLADFGNALGELIPKYSDRTTSKEDYIGIVQLRPEVKQEERLATQDNGELRPHTAHSWGVQRPRYFGLLMIDPGWIDTESGKRGESLFVRVEEVLEEMHKQYPDTYEEDIHMLMSTSIAFPGNRIGEPVAQMPILFFIDDNGTIGVRYREQMLSNLKRIVNTIPNGNSYMASLQKFDHALDSANHVEIQLTSGDLIVLDNRRVTHARRQFISERHDTQDNRLINPRLLYSMHVSLDSFPER